ncbi:uncharacterized protein B0P05DRAFT_570804 [Gilbertella persicaria]|uniref:uncharacterized protein n=1 Tax=Gilbertella persicaria TaxID=101096 RepID=UPI00221F8A9A|nr:uncharacterized protein B0P05DRAFT_570804 [Gilbertella persicaria]KAI8082572.1 hypothetical protein B0P05DRAFT_570804 [Gilbertella persicaria]
MYESWSMRCASLFFKERFSLENIHFLGAILDKYKSSKGFNCKFTRKLQHCGSFLGRDYKVLLQVLPVILVTEFTEASLNLAKVIPYFLKLGKPCSLIFVRKISDQFDDYLRQVDDTVKELLLSFCQYDLTCTTKNHKGYIGKLRVHFLSHIAEDIQRFGAALNLEKGEQFNENICEHIFHTNKNHVPKQIAIKFGKQEVMRHIVDSGPWMDNSSRRVKAGLDVLLFVEENAHDLFGGTTEFIKKQRERFPCASTKRPLTTPPCAS